MDDRYESSTDGRQSSFEISNVADTTREAEQGRSDETRSRNPNTIKSRGKGRRRKVRDRHSVPNLLVTESKAEAERFYADITRDIPPEDAIVQVYVEEFVEYCWQIRRYRRIINGILDNSLRSAAQNVVYRIASSVVGTREDIAAAWLSSQAIAHDFRTGYTEQLLSLLEESQLDETAVEAKAFEFAAAALEKAQRLLSAAEAGRDKALRSIARYRRVFAAHLRLKAGRALAEDQKPNTIANMVN